MADDPGEGDIRTTMASKGVDRHCAIRYLAIEDLKARASNLFENEMKSLLQSEKATKTNEVDLIGSAW